MKQATAERLPISQNWLVLIPRRKTHIIKHFGYVSFCGRDFGDVFHYSYIGMYQPGVHTGDMCDLCEASYLASSESAGPPGPYVSPFAKGRQPCNKYTPAQENVHGATFDNVHVCYGKKRDGDICGKKVSFCEKCHRDHHEGGYETCRRAKK